MRFGAAAGWGKTSRGLETGRLLFLAGREPMKPQAPQPLIEALRAFNRKERYWVVRNALGKPDEQLRLSEHFRDSFHPALGIRVPEYAWWALDYHIDWLFGALFSLCEPPRTEGSNRVDDQALLTGTQQDFDFVVAFDRTLILIEAKGVGGPNKKQEKSKKDRLAVMAPFLASAGVKMHFCTMSPVKPEEGPHVRLWFDNPNEPFAVVNRTDNFGKHWKGGSVKKPGG